MKNNFLNNIEYFIAIIISILFGIGLIPFTYSKIVILLISLILVQMVLSIINGRIINVIIELILLILAIFSIIPILGFITRFIGMIIGIIEMSTFKNVIIYSKFESNFNSISKKSFKFKKKHNKKKPRNFEDVEFEEK